MKKIFTAIGVIILSSILLMSPSYAAQGTNYYSDDGNSSLFFKSGNANYWYGATCTVCYAGTFTYTGNNYNVEGNVGTWYLTSELYSQDIRYMDAYMNVPNHAGANTTNARFQLCPDLYCGGGYKGIDQKSVYGYQLIHENFRKSLQTSWAIRMVDATFEPYNTTNVGFDTIKWYWDL